MQTRLKLTGPDSCDANARTVDMTPTWRGLMPVLILALENGTREGRTMARAELTRLAGEIDRINAGAGAAGPWLIFTADGYDFYRDAGGRWNVAHRGDSAPSHCAYASPE